VEERDVLSLHRSGRVLDNDEMDGGALGSNARERQDPRSTHTTRNALATPLSEWVARPPTKSGSPISAIGQGVAIHTPFGMALFGFLVSAILAGVAFHAFLVGSHCTQCRKRP